MLWTLQCTVTAKFSHLVKEIKQHIDKKKFTVVPYYTVFQNPAMTMNQEGFQVTGWFVQMAREPEDPNDVIITQIISSETYIYIYIHACCKLMWLISSNHQEDRSKELNKLIDGSRKLAIFCS